MKAQDLEPLRGENLLRSYKSYKQMFDRSGDHASLAHSLSILDDFIKLEADREEPRVRCTTLDFSVQESGSSPAARAIHSTGLAGVEAFLSGLTREPQEVEGHDDADDASFLLVENLSPETVVSLGLRLRIPPYFWSEYLENRPWFLRRRVVSQWLRLPSVQAAQSFIKIQRVVPRPFHWNFDSDQKEEATLPDPDALLWINTDHKTSRVRRVAGILQPRTAKMEAMAPVAFTRETFMVWIDKRVDGRLVGLILIDPPFHAKGVDFQEFNQPTAQDDMAIYPGVQTWLGLNKREEYQKYWGAETLPPPASMRESFASILACELSASMGRRAEVMENPFTALKGLYQAIASEWLLIDEYVERELDIISYALEHDDQKLHTLQAFLRDLLAMKRRWSRYRELAQIAQRQCQEQGCHLWRSTAIDEKKNSAADHSLIVQDFQYVLVRLDLTRERIETNITVLIGLVSISEAEQTVTDGQGITRLTRVAAVFLPFSAVAAIMAIPNANFGPGGEEFWIYWVVSIIVTAASLWLAGGSAAANSRAIKRKVRMSWKTKKAAQRKEQSFA